MATGAGAPAEMQASCSACLPGARVICLNINAGTDQCTCYAACESIDQE